MRTPTSDTAAGPDWNDVRQETIRHLQAVIRLDTTNPPGDELRVARYLDEVLRSAGIETQLLEPTAGRGAVVARLRGDGSREPLLLLAHMDVVGVVRESWSVAPFGGVVKDGYVYGRGAIDDKGMLVTNLVAMLLVKRHVLDAGGTLARDVVFLATSDEEGSGEWGIGWLAVNHPGLLRGEYALNEGGRVRVVRGRPLYAAVQCAEKVSHHVTVSARGQGGHSSIPLRENPIWRLGRALSALAAHREPVQLIPTTRRFFAGLAAVWPDDAERRAMTDVASRDADRARRGARVLAKVPLFDAVLRTGVSATVLEGGLRSNVIPSSASVSLNVRTLPGQRLEAVIERLRRRIADPRVDVTIASRGDDAPVSDHESPMFEAIGEALRALDPALAVVPYLSTGATDSAVLRRAGVQAFGLLPFPLAPEDEERMHGHDERVPVASLEFGARLTYDVLCRMAVGVGR